MAKAIEAGWGVTAVDRDALRLAFSRPERRKLHQGAIRYANRLWTSDALLTYQGDHVMPLVPQYEEHSRLAMQSCRRNAGAGRRA